MSTPNEDAHAAFKAALARVFQRHPAEPYVAVRIEDMTRAALRDPALQSEELQAHYSNFQRMCKHAAAFARTLDFFVSPPMWMLNVQGRVIWTVREEYDKRQRRAKATMSWSIRKDIDVELLDLTMNQKD